MKKFQLLAGVSQIGIAALMPAWAAEPETVTFVRKDGEVVVSRER